MIKQPFNQLRELVTFVNVFIQTDSKVSSLRDKLLYANIEIEVDSLFDKSLITLIKV